MEYYDNTMISSFKECPRKFLFRHRFHWRKAGISAPLVFGLSWHDAMDVVWGLSNSTLTDSEIRKAAMTAFMATWEESGFDIFTDETNKIQLYDTKYGMRNPSTAAEMLANYIKLRRDWISEREIISIEQPFVVQLNSENYYIGRNDKIVKETNGDYYIIEHKTTSYYSKDSGIRKQFIDGFDINSQIDGYLHSGHTIYGKKLKGVWIDAALVHKTHHNIFRWVAIDKTNANIKSFVNEVKNWIGAIKVNDIIYNKGIKEEDGEALMSAFPRNSGSCFNFNSKCSYFDICRSVQLTKDIEMPDNFIKEKWEPFDVLNIQELKDDS